MLIVLGKQTHWCDLQANEYGSTNIVSSRVVPVASSPIFSLTPTTRSQRWVLASFFIISQSEIIVVIMLALDVDWFWLALLDGDCWYVTHCKNEVAIVSGVVAKYLSAHSMLLSHQANQVANINMLKYSSLKKIIECKSRELFLRKTSATDGIIVMHRPLCVCF